MSKVIKYSSNNLRLLYDEIINSDVPYYIPIVDNGALYDISDGIVSIPLEHHKIHIGNHFFYKNSANILGNGIYQFVHNTYDCKPHIYFTIDYTDAPVRMEVYENIESFVGGTEIHFFNNNRNYTNLSKSTIYENPSSVIIGDNAIKYIDFRVGGTTTGGGRGGQTRDENERVLKPNTLYLVRITNLINQPNMVNMVSNLYETNQF